MNHLPDEAARIATEQGWNDESIIIHLLGFIQHDASGEAPEEPAWEARLAVYLRTCADDEILAATPCPDCNSYAVAPGDVGGASAGGAGPALGDRRPRRTTACWGLKPNYPMD